MINFFDYIYLDQKGAEVSKTFISLIDALKQAARDHESNIRTPLEIRTAETKYDNQDILMMCQKYNLFK